jgi:hypothetical protein
MQKHHPSILFIVTLIHIYSKRGSDMISYSWRVRIRNGLCNRLYIY